MLLLIGLLLAGCQNEEVGPQSTVDQESGVFAYNDGLLVANEGTFNFGNASVTYYQPENNTSVSNIFDRQNDMPLGDVLQSVYLDSDDLYLVVNNSSRIAVVDPLTFRLRRDFYGMGSPRHLVRYGNRLFVSQLFDPHLWVIDASTGALLDKWPTAGWTERMILLDSVLWVESVNSQELISFDLNNDSVLTPVLVQGGPYGCIKANDRIYGLIGMGVGSRLFELNSADFSISREYNLAPLDAKHMGFDESENKLYFWSYGDVYQFDLADWQLETNSIFTTGNRNVGGLYLDPQDRDWYYTDVLDFATRGWLYRMNSQFELTDSVRTGFIPRIVLRP